MTIPLFGQEIGRHGRVVWILCMALPSGLLGYIAAVDTCRGDELPHDERIRVGISRTRQLIGMKVCDNICDGKREKLLTWDPEGVNNSTWLHIDGVEIAFGAPNFERVLGRPPSSQMPEGRSRPRAEAHWSGPKGIKVVQRVALIANEADLFDTCKVWYTITNLDSGRHTVKLRVVINTCVGNNANCPFVWDDDQKTITTSRDTAVGNSQIRIPDHVDALEGQTLTDHGLVARLQILNRDFSDIPTRFIITQLPKERPFEVKKASDITDSSAVVIYWEKVLESKKSFDVGYCYGKGKLSTQNRR